MGEPIDPIRISNKKRLLRSLINSLKDEPGNWEFRNYRAANRVWGIELRIDYGIKVYKPSVVKFNIFERIALRRAVNECKAIFLVNKKYKGN